MNHRRHLHLRNFLIFWNIYFTSSLVIPTDNGKHSTSTQFGRRGISATHLAIESSSDSKEAVSLLPTMLKSQSLPTTSSLRNSALSSSSLGRNKITLLEGDSVPLLNPWGLRSEEQLEKSASTTSIGGKGKELDKLNSSWWKNQLPRILKSWWKTVINHLSSFQKSIKRGFGKIIPSRPYTVLSKSPSSHVISPSDRSTIDEGTKVLDGTIANDVTKIPHGSIDDPATRTPHDSTVDEGKKTPHESTVEQATKIPFDAIADQTTTTPHEPTVEQVTRNHDESIPNQATTPPHESAVQGATKTPLDTIADQGTAAPHEPIVEQVTKNHDESIANQAITTPHESAVEKATKTPLDTIADQGKTTPPELTIEQATRSHDGSIANQATQIPHESAVEEGTKAPLDTIADQGTTTAHEPTIDQATRSHDESIAKQETKIPHDHSHEDDEIFHDALSEFQDNIPDEHETFLSTEPQPHLKENHVPAGAEAALKEKLSPEKAQGLPKATLPAEEQAAPKEKQSLLEEDHAPAQAQSSLKVLPKETLPAEAQAASKGNLFTEEQALLDENHVPTKAQAALKVVPEETLPAEKQAASKENLSTKEHTSLEENHIPTEAQAVLKEKLSPEKAQVLPKDTRPVQEQAASKVLSTKEQASLEATQNPAQAQAALKENFSPKEAQASPKENHPPTVPQVPLEGTHSPNPDASPASLAPVLAAPVSKSISDTPEASLHAISAKPLPSTAEPFSNVRASNPSSAATKTSTRTPPISTAVDNVFRPTFRDTELTAKSLAKPKAYLVKQSQLAIAEISWELMRRGEQWDTVFEKLYPGWTLGLAGRGSKHLQKYTDLWELQYEIAKRTSGVDHLKNSKTLREALDKPSDAATRKGYDIFIATLQGKMDETFVKTITTADKMTKLQKNIAKQLQDWDKSKI
ncbi:uncharacterized protein MELLADRAFT_93689 [Melampsora larici-populina 98AG31]|uniref:Secreted protein n=1 Tax=Melampsora larici-populina (strain 98AG31 / pathotype 3-4-7) TaxID=747676 RepID=F4S4X1_MELLP|nr:uncharacterized protein MELLADRAFT_93689 [Melampsora larici-populina 98AG31]EGG00308.1 hypothetical protein MELLADRAFT_93689 [Melampsora larici-populina 98AG31]